ncbi:hypothetical protein SAMN04487944_12841 [Gracilibacillus ureilyticus]|uniref:Uncharacterized protein n=1 Tax=Gracilibacillus ureilyticus TaxID=531814 RepID=A0A1H9VWE3_9BACI|nr:hypothetical protein SAMN04487944_12841 [Gracilibacillus ureilyticus]
MEDRDETEASLSNKASWLSYWILMICLGIILFAAEGTGMLTELENIPLVICFSLSIVIYPMVRAIIFLIEHRE